MVRGEGIEPSTNWLKANCSTAELPALPVKGAGMYSQAGTVQAGIAHCVDFLHKHIEAVFGTLDQKSAQSRRLGTVQIAFLIIPDV